MADDDESFSRIRTFLGRSRRNETWYLTDEVEVVTVIGRTQFDLRNVRSTGREAVEIRVVCILGSVDFIVPAGTLAVLDGSSVLASARSNVSDGDNNDLPRLEIEATTVLGRVRVRSIPVECPEPDSVDATVSQIDSTQETPVETSQEDPVHAQAADDSADEAAA